MVESLFRLLGGLVCHQMPERTLFISGMPLPVCARCTGIYLGMFVSVVFLVCANRLKCDKPFSPAATLLIAAALTPMLLDGVSSYAALRETTNFIRILTGAPFGACIPVLYILALGYNIDGPNTRVIASGWELAAVLTAAALLAVAVNAGFINNWFIVSAVISIVIAAGFAGLVYLVLRRVTVMRG